MIITAYQLHMKIPSLTTFTLSDRKKTEEFRVYYTSYVKLTYDIKSYAKI